MDKTLRLDLSVALGGLAFLLAWDLSGLDLLMVRQLGDARGFAWREAWLTRGIFHEGGRLLAAGVLLALLANVCWPLLDGPTRGERIYMLVAAILCMSLIPLCSSAPASPAAPTTWPSSAA